MSLIDESNLSYSKAIEFFHNLIFNIVFSKISTQLTSCICDTLVYRHIVYKRLKWTYESDKKVNSFSFRKINPTQKKARQLSQEQLGFLSNLDRTYISGVERGIRNPSLTAIVSLASGLDITVSELLENLETEVANISNE